MPKKTRSYLGLISAMIFWSLSFVWVKETYVFFTPITLVFFRLILSSLLLWTIGKALGRINPIKKGTLNYLLLLAFFEPLCYFLGESFGLTMVSPTMGALIIATAPLMVALFSAWVLKEKLPLINLIGSLLSFGGVLFLLLLKDQNLTGQLWGVLLMFVAVFSIVGYTFVLHKVADDYSPLSIITYQNTFGILMFAPLFFIFDWQTLSLTDVPQGVWYKLLMLAVFASSLAYLFFIDAIRNIGLAKANYFINMIPVFTAIFAVSRGHDSFSTGLLLGIGLVVTGLFISQVKGTYVKKILKRAIKRKSPKG